jgi:excinuclease ABC subunit C
MIKGFKVISKKDVGRLPKTAGVYCLTAPKPRGEGGFDVVYIGKAINIKDRVKNHFQQPSYRDNLFIDKITKIGFFETGSEIEALILEANLIKKYQPKFNVIWKDDKNYFYVAIAYNKQKIPYIFITHQPKKIHPVIRQGALSNDRAKSEYIGPFVEGTALKKTLRFLRRAFPYYTSGKHSKIKCTWCHLDLCPGPNPNLIEYKKNIKKLILILKGKRGAVLNSLKKEMSRYARSGVARKHTDENRDFEEAGKIRDRIYNLQQVMAHTHVIENSKSEALNSKPDEMLAKIIDLERPATKIECYDVSNIQGKQATGSMVVFINGKTDKNQYRKFKIKMKNEPNDIAMLKETLQRRFLHPEWKYPDVILIDGGKAQLNIAIKNKNAKKETEGIKVISIAKRNKELFIESRKKPVLLKTLPQEVYNLILRLDDEAHRFAITYHKKLRKNNLLR